MARLFPRLASPSLQKNEKRLQLDIVAVLDHLLISPCHTNNDGVVIVCMT